MPKWLLFLAVTHATPIRRALLMASSMQNSATTPPSPSRPSTSAAPGVSCSTTGAVLGRQIPLGRAQLS